MLKVPFFTNLIATGLFLGKSPIMPGTFGSLLAIPLAYIAIYLTTFGKVLYFGVFFLIGIFVTSRYIKFTGKHDPGEVVIDEYVALILFYMVFPFKPIYIIAGFILFRIFDILKPFPVNYFDEMNSALGVMLDDIMAVLYAIVVTMIFKIIFEAISKI